MAPAYTRFDGAASREAARLQRFQTEIAHILGTLADIVQPRTIEQLDQWDFADPPREPQ